MYFGQKRVRVLSSGLHSPKENAEGWKRVPQTVFAGLRKLSTLLFSWKQRCFNAVLASPSTTPSYEQEKKQLPMIVPLPSLGRGHKWVRAIGTWETLRNQTFSKTQNQSSDFWKRSSFSCGRHKRTEKKIFCTDWKRWTKELLRRFSKTTLHFTLNIGRVVTDKVRFPIVSSRLRVDSKNEEKSLRANENLFENSYLNLSVFILKRLKRLNTRGRGLTQSPRKCAPDRVGDIEDVTG